MTGGGTPMLGLVAITASRYRLDARGKPGWLARCFKEVDANETKDQFFGLPKPISNNCSAASVASSPV